jgi:hypothetical protein
MAAVSRLLTDSCRSSTFSFSSGRRSVCGLYTVRKPSAARHRVTDIE